MDLTAVGASPHLPHPQPRTHLLLKPFLPQETVPVFHHAGCQALPPQETVLFFPMVGT